MAVWFMTSDVQVKFSLLNLLHSVRKTVKMINQDNVIDKNQYCNGNRHMNVTD